MCLVSVICISNLFKRCLGIVLVFAILSIAPLISESPLSNVSATMAILLKFLGTFSSYTSKILLTLIFGEFIFNFDLSLLSYVNLLHHHVSTYPQK